MFHAVSSRVSFPDLDAETLQYWKDRDVFRRSVDRTPRRPSLYDVRGPAHRQRQPRHSPRPGPRL